MRWTYILYLPVLTSLFWPVLTVMLKKHPTRSQLLLSLTLVFEAAAMLMLGIFFRGRAGCLFIYDYLIEAIAVVCGPLYYIGICSLTEPNGVNLRQRQVLLLPFLFILGLTIAAWRLGPRRYETLCLMIHEGNFDWFSGDAEMQFMMVWHSILFPALMLIYNFVLLVIAERKLVIYRRRFNSFYAEKIGVHLSHSRAIDFFMWLFLPLGLVAVLLVESRPYYAKYYLIVTAVLLAAVQVFYGRYVYKLDYDARYLAQLVRNDMDKK